MRIDASIDEYQRLIGWAKAWPARTWAIENADGLGHHLALWLLARGEVVVDIPTTATARVRELSRGGRRKNDRIDAAAAASVAALQGDARQVYPETITDSLALLDERRVNLSHNRTRTVNQLHALLRDLLAGGAPTALTPAVATSVLRGFRPRTDPDRIRVELAKELIVHGHVIPQGWPSRNSPGSGAAEVRVSGLAAGVRWSWCRVVSGVGRTGRP